MATINRKQNLLLFYQSQVLTYIHRYSVMKNTKFLLISFFSIFVFFSCQKEKFISDSSAKLEFSTDSVLFDTVFASVGSATSFFMVRNPHSESIRISSINLAGGSTSSYRLNINGTPGNSAQNIEIGAKDSLFIFVEVLIDPAHSNLIEEDSLVFNTNGNRQRVVLTAFGMDVHLIKHSLIETQTWSNDKPYLIYDTLQVAQNATLTISQGVHVYSHRNALLQVLGTLKVNGTKDEPVIFEGDRLEKPYFDVPNQWSGIHLTKVSSNNVINYAEIRNAFVGIRIDSVQNEYPMLSIHNSIIEHHSFVGIYALSSTVFATNCLIDDCGYYAVGLMLGGSYWFYNCTIGNYWQNTIRNSASLVLNNYFEYNNTSYVYTLNHAYFGNCIIWGNKDSEMLTDSFPQAGIFNYHFENCILKIDPKQNFNTNNSNHFIDNLINIDPKFKKPYEYDCSLDTLTPAKDAGSLEIINQFPSFLNFDILGNSRTTDSKPDIGAFERIE